jgi:hypothetical protein
MGNRQGPTGRSRAVQATAASDPESLAGTVGFELAGPALGRDLEDALRDALANGAAFLSGTDPVSVFRHRLAASIRGVESHPRGRLLQEFLLKGPYEGAGEIPATLVGRRLSDAECASAIAFIYSHTVNCFKGGIAELLAANACLHLMEELREHEGLPAGARLCVGDAVGVRRAGRKGLLKGADMHIVVEEEGMDGRPRVVVAGVAEVKSYSASQRRLRGQLEGHLRRARGGLQVDGREYPAERVALGYGEGRRVARVGVLPGTWRLPRSFRFEESGGRRVLRVDPGGPGGRDDGVGRIGKDEWRITLRWSREALARAAYEMTFWYMARLGEVAYAGRVPEEWEGMTPAEAGRNAAKMMLYYAILRCRTVREQQRAIALYNTYGYGYALGMNYRDAKGRRAMLWPQDLDEILSGGRTASGCTIR